MATLMTAALPDELAAAAAPVLEALPPLPPPPVAEADEAELEAVAEPPVASTEDALRVPHMTDRQAV